MRSSLVCLAGLLAGCLPNEAPYWLIDHPVARGIRISVTRPGGYASGLIVPDGQVRASALPLDTIELEWLTLAPEEVELAPPIWIVCGNNCTQLNWPELPDCPQPTPLLLQSPCRLGEGHRLSLVLDGAWGDNVFGGLPVMAVGSADPEVSPETCLQRLLTSPKRDLASCLMISREYTIGASGPPTGLPDPSGPFDPPMPGDPDVPMAPPQVADTHPIVEGFQVVTSDKTHVVVPDGGAATVRPGAEVTVMPVLAPDAAQEYFRATSDGAGGWLWVPEREQLVIHVASTGWVEQWNHVDGPPMVQFVVPDGLGPFDLHFYVVDRREGRTTASLRIVPEDMSKTP